MRLALLRSPTSSALAGIALFLFIPAVLFLFVAHPAPIGASLAAGVALMVGHRFLATPYFRAIRPATCAWCHGALTVDSPPMRALALSAGTESLEILTCERHAEPTRRFFNFLDRMRTPLRIGIALPLLLLLATLALAAAGVGSAAARLPEVTDLFRLIVGITVNVAALGPLTGAPAPAARAAFPVHNFYLLGIRAILWIFRLVGVGWILSALSSLLSD